MTNPLVLEDGVLKLISNSGRAADVHKLILLGQRRATPILIVELTPSSSSDAEVRAWLWPLVQEANKVLDVKCPVSGIRMRARAHTHTHHVTLQNITSHHITYITGERPVPFGRD